MRSKRLNCMRVHRFSQSSTIDRIAYDAAARTLSIAFYDSGKYIYDGVPETLFEAFCRAGSAGAFFHERVRNRFRFRRDPERRGFGPNA
ncbi:MULTISPECIES: KTSC domain-containing protein [unclassified Sphingopyxis]|uniref:KTSC domain-containing protein n=1 Tax=unclassified Sphingopyxis TaxID=2614943 RepID=UPI0025D7E1AA|nr:MULTISPECIES: KTSC domain-containing protein [unclassified Sphingopyxis]